MKNKVCQSISCVNGRAKEALNVVNSKVRASLEQQTLIIFEKSLDIFAYCNFIPFEKFKKQKIQLNRTKIGLVTIENIPVTVKKAWDEESIHEIVDEEVERQFRKFTKNPSETAQDSQQEDKDNQPQKQMKDEENPSEKGEQGEPGRKEEVEAEKIFKMKSPRQRTCFQFFAFLSMAMGFFVVFRLAQSLMAQFNGVDSQLIIHMVYWLKHQSALMHWLTVLIYPHEMMHMLNQNRWLTKHFKGISVCSKTWNSSGVCIFLVTSFTFIYVNLIWIFTYIFATSPEYPFFLYSVIPENFKHPLLCGFYLVFSSFISILSMTLSFYGYLIFAMHVYSIKMWETKLLDAIKNEKRAKSLTLQRAQELKNGYRFLHVHSDLFNSVYRNIVCPQLAFFWMCCLVICIYNVVTKFGVALWFIYTLLVIVGIVGFVFIMGLCRDFGWIYCGSLWILEELKTIEEFTREERHLTRVDFRALQRIKIKCLNLGFFGPDTWSRMLYEVFNYVVLFIVNFS